MSDLLSRPRRLYGLLAAAEMVTWTFLLAGMTATYLLDAGHLPVRAGGSLHGFVFLAYALVTLVVGVDQRWPGRDLVLGLASAVVPFATVPFERSAARRGLLGERWQLRDGGRSPSGPVEGLVAAAVGRPALAGLLGVVGLSVTFAVLLALGPPTQWFA